MSPLREALAGYLSVRRALGFRLDRAEKLIGQFIDYLEERQAGVVTIEHAVAWATAPAGAASWWHALRLSAVRPFASWLHSLDDAHEVPPAGLIPHGPHRAVPYLYSADEIGALVTAAGPPSPAGQRRHLPGPDRPAGGDRRPRRGAARPGKQRLRRRPRHPDRPQRQVRQTAAAPAAPDRHRSAGAIPAGTGPAAPGPARRRAARVQRRHEAGLLPGSSKRSAASPPRPGSRPGPRPAVRESTT